MGAYDDIFAEGNAGEWGQRSDAYRANMPKAAGETLTLLNQELQGETDPGNIAALQREIARAQKVAGPASAPAPAQTPAAAPARGAYDDLFEEPAAPAPAAPAAPRESVQMPSLSDAETGMQSAATIPVSAGNTANLPGSVMNGVQSMASGQSDPALSMVTDGFKSSIRERMNASTPEQRARLLAAPGMIGRVARMLDQAAVFPSAPKQETQSDRRRQMAQDNPKLSALAAGSAQTMQGILESVPLVADAVNEYAINPFLRAAGAQPMAPAARIPGAAYLQQAAQDFTPDIVKQSLSDAWESDQFGAWLATQMAQQAPQIAQSTAAAFVPALRAPYLLSMGAQSGGLQYQQNKEGNYDQGRAIANALVDGNIEILSEMLPLGVFDKVSAYVGRLSAPARNMFLTELAKRIGVAGTALTANMATNAVEESVAQVGQNISGNTILNKSTPVMEGVPEAATIGAASGSIMGAGQVARAASAPGPDAEIANAIDQAVRGSEFTTSADSIAREALNPANAQMQVDPVEQADRLRAEQQAVDRADLTAVINDPRPMAEIQAEREQQAAEQSAQEAAAQQQGLAEQQAQVAAVAEQFGMPAPGQRTIATLPTGETVAGSVVTVADENGTPVIQLRDDEGNEYALGPQDAQFRPEPVGTGQQGAPVVVERTEDIAIAERQVDTNPTEAQKDSGNYAMGHVKLQGLDITIENPAGSTRTGVDKNGKPWSSQIMHTYGYIKGSTAKDGDHIDVFLGPQAADGQSVFVVDQIDPDTGRYDEAKALVGFADGQAALEGYLSNYEAGWRGAGAMTEMSMPEFKAWLAKGNTKKPLRYKQQKAQPVPVQSTSEAQDGRQENRTSRAQDPVSGAQARPAPDGQGAAPVAEAGPEPVFIGYSGKNIGSKSKLTLERMPDGQYRLLQDGYPMEDYDTGEDVLLSGTPEEIAENIRANMEDLFGKGRKFFGPDASKAGKKESAKPVEIGKKLEDYSDAQLDQAFKNTRNATARAQIQAERARRKQNTPAATQPQKDANASTPQPAIPAADAVPPAPADVGRADAASAAARAGNAQTKAPDPAEPSRPAPDAVGEQAVFNTRADANAAMLEAVMATDRVHEVIERADGRFEVRAATIEDLLASADPEVLDAIADAYDDVTLSPENVSDEAIDTYFDDEAEGRPASEVGTAEAEGGTDQGDQAAPEVSAQHIENGQSEPATAAVITQAVKKSASNTPMNLKQARIDLLANVDAAILVLKEGIATYDHLSGKEWKDARDAFDKTREKKITFEVPGDGKFTVLNEVENLETFRAKIAVNKGFEPGYGKKGFAGRTFAVGTSPETAVKQMLEEGEMVAAHELANTTGKPFRFTRNTKGGPPNLFTDTRDVAAMPFGIAGFVGRLHGLKGKSWAFVESTTGNTIGGYAAAAGPAESGARAALVKAGEEKIKGALATSGKINPAELEVEWLEAAEKSDQEYADRADMASQRNIAEKKAKDEARDTWNRITGQKDIPVNAAAPIVRAALDKAADQDALEDLISVVENHMTPAAYPDLYKSLIEAARKRNATMDRGPTPGDVIRNLVGKSVVDMTERDVAYVLEAPGVDVVALADFITEKRLGLSSKVKNVARELGFTPAWDGRYVKANQPTRTDRIGDQAKAKESAKSEIPEGYKPVGEPYYKDSVLTQGYAQHAVGDRVIDMDTGYAGTVDAMNSEGPFFRRAIVKFDNKTTTTLAMSRLKPEVKEKPSALKARDDLLGDVTSDDFRPTFYSALLKTVPDMAKVADKNGMIGREQARLWLMARQKEGKFKAEEMAWTGIDDFLKLEAGKIAVDDIEAFVRDNGVRIEEVEKGGDRIAALQKQIDEINDRYNAIIDEHGVTLQDLPADAKKEIDALTEKHDEIADRMAKMHPNDDASKYASYQLPGGENYRELLLTLPSRNGPELDALLKRRTEIEVPYMERGQDLPDSVMTEWRELSEKIRALRAAKQQEYKSSHWDESNIIAHIRFNDRTDADGNKVLFIEELQSDWGQDGKKKGFSNPSRTFTQYAVKDGSGTIVFQVNDRSAAEERMETARTALESAGRGNEASGWSIAPVEVNEATANNEPNRPPAAPFVGDTKGWLSLGIKRMIRYAAENGYDKIAFVNGDQSADRYDLSKQIKEIEYIKRGDKYELGVTGINGEGVDLPKSEFAADELENVVGKEVAQKIVNGEGRKYRGHEGITLEGLDLKVGGTGMKTFYDKIVPQTVNDVLKKLGGGKVTPITLSGDGVYRVSVDGEFQDASTLGQARDIADRTGGTISTMSGSQQTGFVITDAIRDKAMAGLPLFNKSATSPQRAFDLNLYAAIASGSSSRDILTRIASESASENNRELAQALLDAGIAPTIEIGQAKDNTFTVKDQPKGAKFAAGYSPKRDAILMFTSVAAEKHTLHESVHAATFKALRKGGPNAIQMKRLYQHVKQQGGARGAYGMSNFDEFTAEALSNPEFQDRLRAITAMPEGSKFANAWDWFVDLVRRMLNLPAKASTVTALDQALRYGRGLMGENRADGQRGEELLGDIAADQDSAAAAPAERAERAGFDIPRHTGLRQTQERVQDRMNRLKVIIKAVAEQDGTVTDENNFYKAEERYHGRVSARLDDFMDEVEQFIADAKTADIALDQIALYAYAKHAPSRNRAARAINPEVTTGSGMSDAAAAQIIAGAKTGTAPLATRLAKMSERTLEIQVRAGLITTEQANRLKAKWDFYVPLRGFETIDEDGKTVRGRGIGQGLDIRGKEFKQALGRDSRAGQIIENIILDRERAFVRSEKNEILKRFLLFVRDNPDANLWEIDKKRSKIVSVSEERQLTRLLKDLELDRRDLSESQVADLKETHGITGATTNKVTINENEQTIGLKVAGKPVYISIKDKTLFEQLKRLNEDSVPEALAIVGAFNRFLARSYTAWSPVFALMTNPIRDAQTALIGMTGEAGIKGPVLWAKNWPKAVTAAFEYEALGKRNALYDEYRNMGGKTGFYDLKSLPDKMRELQVLWEDATKQPTEGKEWRYYGRKLAKPLLVFEDVISRLAGTFENASRLAAYQSMKDIGQSKEQAASVAKNLTVNFNRRGTWGPALSSWFLFYNPAVQGTARIHEVLFQTKHKKEVWAVLGLGMAAIAALTMMNADAGEDDDEIPWWDKIPQHEKDRNLIIVLPPYMKEIGEAIPNSKTGRYLKLPMPYGYNIFPRAAQLMTDVVRNQRDGAHGLKSGAAAAELLKSFIASYNPVGGERPFEQTIAGPFGMVVQHTTNVSSFGSPLYPEMDFDKGLPDSEKYSVRDKGGPYQRWAAFVNQATGGTKYEEGGISVPPGVWRNYWRGITGGIGSFFGDMADSYGTSDITRAPFVRQAFGEIGVRNDASLYYEIAEKAEEAHATAMRAAKAGDGPIAMEMARTNPLVRLGSIVDGSRGRLSQLRKQEMAVIDSKVYAQAEKDRRRKLIEQNRGKVFQDFLSTWRKEIRKGEQ